MIVTVQLYAFLRETLGDSVDIDLEEPVTTARLMERFIELYPQFAESKDSLSLAVDQDYVAEDREIGPGQEVAIFPPVSGGIA